MNLEQHWNTKMSAEPATKIDYSEYISRVENYLLWTQGVHVHYEKGQQTALYSEGHGITDDDFIIIDKSKRKEWQLYALLHEAGHVILRKNRKDHKKSFPMSEHKTNTIGKRVDVIREEVMAWERAKRLSVELQIYIHTEKWNKQRTKSLMEYVKWAYNPKEYKVD